MVLTNQDSDLVLLSNVQVLKGRGINFYKNRVLQDGLLYLAEFIHGEPDGEINYIGVGDSSEPNRLSTSSLGNERFRKPFTAKSMNNQHPVFETFFTEDEANFRWRELGLYAGGSDEANSGRLIARVVVDETKNDNVTISTNWEFRIANS